MILLRLGCSSATALSVVTLFFPPSKQTSKQARRTKEEQEQTSTNKQASTTAQRNRHKECERKGETTPHRKRMPPAAKKPKVKAIKDEKGEEMCSDLCVGVWNVWVWNV